MWTSLGLELGMQICERYCLSKNADCGNKCVWTPGLNLQSSCASPLHAFVDINGIQTVGVGSVTPPKVWKASPEEKVGVMAKKGGRPSVVEYSASGQIHDIFMTCRHLKWCFSRLRVYFRFRTNMKVGSLHMRMAFELLADSCLPCLWSFWSDRSLQQVLRSFVHKRRAHQSVQCIHYPKTSQHSLWLQSSQNEKTSAYQLCFPHDDHSVQICPRETCREPAAKVLDIELPMTGELDDARKTLRDSNGRLVFGAMALRSSPEMFRGFIYVYLCPGMCQQFQTVNMRAIEREREPTCRHVPQLHINQKEPKNAVS